MATTNDRSTTEDWIEIEFPAESCTGRDLDLKRRFQMTLRDIRQQKEREDHGSKASKARQEAVAQKDK